MKARVSSCVNIDQCSFEIGCIPLLVNPSPEAPYRHLSVQ